MTKEWIHYLETVSAIIEKEMAETDLLFFRGHSDSSWSLLPSLYRKVNKNKQRLKYLESTFYYDFISNGGSLLGRIEKKSWELLFIMQHYGVPTRLLDWTENFATALYFALDNEQPNSPEIWILNPYKLNGKTEHIGEYIINPDLDLTSSYYDTFIDVKNGVQSWDVPIAIYPFRANNRIFNQRGLFTVQGVTMEPLEKLVDDCIHRLPIPKKAISDARKFLDLTGVNAFSIYNDLQSLAGHLCKKIGL